MPKGGIEIKGYQRGYSCLNLKVSGTSHFSGTIEIDNKIISQKQNLILSSSDTSKVYISGNLETEEQLLVKSHAIISGNLLVGGYIWDLNSNLILSSAIGSVIAASGSLDFPNQDKKYHIRSVNSDLIISCSLGDIAFSSALKFQNVGKNAQISSFDSHLVLSSTAGSVVAFSASQDFTNSDKDYHIRAVNSDLILSSSSTSKIVVSGTNITFTVQPFSKTGHISTKSNFLILSASTIAFSGSILIDPTAGNWLQARGAGLATSGRIFTAGTVASEIFGIHSSLTPPVKVGSSVAADVGLYNISRIGWVSQQTGGNDVYDISMSASNHQTLSFVGKSGSVILNNQSGHLILSSTLGSVVCISGNLRTNGFRVGYVSVTSQYSALLDDCFISADATAGSFGIVLPTAVGNPGKIYFIKKIDNIANVIVSGTIPQTIDGAAIQTISSQWTCLQVISNGANWLIT